MEELVGALLAGLAELLVEAIFQVFLESLCALVVRGIGKISEETSEFPPVLASAGYLILGVLSGLASVYVFPHPIFHPARFHGISLIVSPMLTGLAMAKLGALLRRKGKQTVRLESFGYGFIFALGMAGIRFLCVR